LIAGLAAFAIAIATRSVILTILGGMLALTLARLVTG
jgi:branched-subunit amino acid transport protein